MADLQGFVEFASHLKGDEKSEAQLFCDRLFRAFGHGGIIEADGELEARIKFSTGKTKFADCLWAPHGRAGVLIEMKKRSETKLEKHFPQVRDYWVEMNPEVVIGPGAQKPEYIILCNFDRFIIYRYLTRVDEVRLSELVDRQTAFNFLLPEKREPIFHNNVAAISQEVAGTIGELFKHLVFDKHVDREKSQHFVLQCVLSLFAEDFDLLPSGFFSELVRDCKRGASSYDLVGNLFRQMASAERASGGRFWEVPYFDGGLFKKVEPIDLDSRGIDLLEEATSKNWKNVNPAIFGALFESTMSEEERHAFGAHFTSEADILKIVNPTIVRPWKNLIEKASSLGELKGLLDEISRFRVLDPACGCGNFLFVAYRSLRDIEMQLIEKIAENYSRTSKLKLDISKVATSQFFGIDVQPIAVEVAKMTMMLAKELAADAWNDRISPLLEALGLGYDQGLPLDTLDDNICCKDALLEPWPEFDVVIGNPPFQSKNKIKQEMDNAYVERVRQAFPEVPGRADFCVYWYKKAHDLLKPGRRAGLVGTNTIRQNYSRIGGLDYIVNNGGTITDAVSTQVWSGDSDVHVSIVNWVKGTFDGEKLLVFQKGDRIDSPFEYSHPEEINSSLSDKTDVGEAKALAKNRDSECCYQGQTQGHKDFLLKKDAALRLIAKDRKNKDVLFPFLTGAHLLSYPDSMPRRYVIDFRKLDVFGAQSYLDLYAIISKKVYNDRKTACDKELKRNQEALAKNPAARVNHHHANFFAQWWRLSYDRSELMDKIEGLSRYCVCSRVTKRPVFEFVSRYIHPNDALQVFPLEDDYSFGILQSSIHWEWFKARCSTLTERFRYTSDTVFDSFPWPQNASQSDVEQIARQSLQLRLKRREIMKRDNLSLRALYRVIESTPNNPVSVVQDKLDGAVRKAYGMSKSKDVLRFLLDLNWKLYAIELQGKEIVVPGLPPFVRNRTQFVSTDCVGTNSV